MTKSGDVITGSKGPIPHDDEHSDVVSTTKGPQPVGDIDDVPDYDAETAPADPDAKSSDEDDEEPEQKPTFKGEGDRDWTDVHKRVVAMAGIPDPGQAGTLNYTENGDLDDEAVEAIEGKTLKAGLAPGTGRAIGNAAKTMGYGVSFTPAPKSSKGR